MFAWDVLPGVVLPAIWFLLAGLSPQQDVYANPDYGLSLLAALGTAGCLGYLLAAISRHHRLRLGARTLFFGPSQVGILSARASCGGEDWPLLVALLFGPLPILFSGLGGWVEARGIPRGARRRAAHSFA